jgi:hypothetical protein
VQAYNLGYRVARKLSVSESVELRRKCVLFPSVLKPKYFRVAHVTRPYSLLPVRFTAGDILHSGIILMGCKLQAGEVAALFLQNLKSLNILTNTIKNPIMCTLRKHSLVWQKWVNWMTYYMHDGYKKYIHTYIYTYIHTYIHTYLFSVENSE